MKLKKVVEIKVVKKEKFENAVSIIEDATGIEMNTQRPRSTSILWSATEVEK